MARQVMDQILKHGKVVRGWLGVVIQPVTPEIAKAFGLPEARGALIGDVTAGAPAAKAGLEKGDVVLQLNSQPIESSRDLQLKVAMMAPGTKVTLHIFRNGAKREVPVTLGQVPDKSGKAGTQSSGAASALDGVSVDELTPDILQQLNLPATTKGVVVTDVGDGSAAAEVGLRSGDVIQQVNKKPVNTVAEFQAAIRLAGSRPVLLLVNRGGSTMFIVVEPG
jgi:serine protease Do